MTNRESQHYSAADGEGEVSYDAQLILVDNVREADDGKVYVSGDELLVICAAASALANELVAAETAQTNHPCKNAIPNAGITDHSCVTPAHETLPWGSHYRNLVAASGHAWVAYALENDAQVQEAAAHTRALAAAHDRDDSDDADDDSAVLETHTPMVRSWRTVLRAPHRR